MSAETESPYDTIQGIIKYYVLLGFLSVLFYWIAWSTWIVAAERQVRRIRFVDYSFGTAEFLRG